jgi:hypothetical protein
MVKLTQIGLKISTEQQQAIAKLYIGIKIENNSLKELKNGYT